MSAGSARHRQGSLPSPYWRRSATAGCRGGRSYKQNSAPRRRCGGDGVQPAGGETEGTRGNEPVARGLLLDVAFGIHRTGGPVSQAARGIEHLVGVDEIGVGIFGGEAGSVADAGQSAVAVIGRAQAVGRAVD